VNIRNPINFLKDSKGDYIRMNKKYPHAVGIKVA